MLFCTGADLNVNIRAMTEDYFIGVHARELERLREQHAAWRTQTHALWARAGFTTGQHIADLGSGPGFTALDLAGIVGATGSVTALDKASAYLQFLESEARRRGMTNVHARDADLTAVDPGAGIFDGAFCRFFLAFLIDALEPVLERIHRSLKPGGVLAVMEYLTLESATCSPPIRGFDAHTRAWIEYYLRNGGDTAVGRTLATKLAGAGFDIASIECVGGMARPGAPWWNWWGRLMADFGEKLVDDGVMAAADLQDLRTDWARASTDPRAFIYTPVLVQIVAKKR
jgi:cyclopropane fatty-acyl-phospholipid synthase-like methyltransferase